MKHLFIAAFAFVTVGFAVESYVDRQYKIFELKRLVETIPVGTQKSAVEELLRNFKLPYYRIPRDEFRFNSATWMVKPLPNEATSALTGSGGGRPGKDDDFVFFVVMFDPHERALVSKAKVLGYW